MDLNHMIHLGVKAYNAASKGYQAYEFVRGLAGGRVNPFLAAYSDYAERAGFRFDAVADHVCAVRVTAGGKQILIGHDGPLTTMAMPAAHEYPAGLLPDAAWAFLEGRNRELATMAWDRCCGPRASWFALLCQALGTPPYYAFREAAVVMAEEAAEVDRLLTAKGLAP